MIANGGMTYAFGANVNCFFHIKEVVEAFNEGIVERLKNVKTIYQNITKDEILTSDDLQKIQICYFIKKFLSNTLLQKM